VSPRPGIVRRSAELGYLFLPEAWGFGYAAEAALPDVVGPGPQALAPRRAAASGWRQSGSLAHSCRLGDNDGMARDHSGDRLLRRLALMSVLDGTRPSEPLEWVSPVAPVVTQAAVGAGHWAAGRRQRALAAWASAAGFGLVAWGLGTEAPTRAETQKNIEQQKDLWRERGIEVPATARTQTPTARQRSRLAPLIGPAFQVVGMINGVRSGLRNPRRLTLLAIAGEAWAAVFWALRAARAVQSRRPRTAAGSALGVAGAVARLRAAAAEPLR
jgi:hypothetical protein